MNSADGPCFCTRPLTNQSHLGCLPYFCAQRVFYCALTFREITNFFPPSNLKCPRDFYFGYLCPKKVNQTYERYLIWHHMKRKCPYVWVSSVWRVMSGSLKVNVSNLGNLCTRVKKVSDMWTKCEALLTSPLQGKNSVKCSFKSSRWEIKCRITHPPPPPLQREEAILATSADPPLHTPLLRM